ncbi:MAG: Rieske (2Fe-2S) protein [Candidatus Bathyarchaeia archaeon]
MSEGFVPVLDEAELKDGGTKLVSVAGKQILLVKQSGKVYGVQNRCPHMGCSLANGALNGFILTCACHGWSFDVRSGEYQRAKSIKLATYECMVSDGKIYVKLHEHV